MFSVEFHKYIIVSVLRLYQNLHELRGDDGTFLKNLKTPFRYKKFLFDQNKYTD